MSRGAQSFKRTELTKAIKAAVKAGVKDWRVEITGGKMVVLAGRPDQSGGREEGKPESSEWD
jgi:hypothetical protein